MDKRLAALMKAWQAVMKKHGKPIQEAIKAAEKLPEERMATAEETGGILKHLAEVSPERTTLMEKYARIAEQGRKTSPELGLKGYIFGSSVIPREHAPVGLGLRGRSPTDVDVYLTGTQRLSEYLEKASPEERKIIEKMFGQKGADIVYERIPSTRTLGDMGAEMVVKGRKKYPGTGYKMIRFLGAVPPAFSLSELLKEEKEKE